MNSKRIVVGRSRPRPALLAGALLLAALAAVGSCGGEGALPLATPPPPPPQPVAPVQVGTIPNQSLVTGQTATLEVSSYFRDPDGGALTYEAASSAAGVVSVSVSGSTLTIVGVADGTATVTATARDPDGLTAAQSFSVTVETPVASAVAVTPGTLSLAAVGDTVRLSAEVRDQAGRPIPGAALSWTSSDPSVATVDGSGLVTAAGDGTASVTATSASASGSASVTVSQRVVSVTVIPAADTIAPGDSLQLTAEALDANGHPVRAAAFSWVSSDASVATVDQSGLVRAVAEGVAAVTAAVGSVSAFAEIVVEVDRSALTALLEGFVEQHDIGAVAVGIMKNGDIIYEGVAGFMDAERLVPVVDNVMMRIASVTKPITAAAIRKLAADGELALDDWVFDLGQPGGGLLSLKPFPHLGDTRFEEITVLHLLRHRAGWDRGAAPDWVFREVRIATEMSVQSPPGRENMVRYILGQPLQFRPGAQRVYSNVGYLVLSLIVEEVSGQDYVSYVREKIFTPLGVPAEDVILGRTFPQDRDPREPWYDGPTGARNVFDPSGPRVPWPDGGWHHEAKVGHGGLVASPRALLEFLDTYHVAGDDIGDPRRKPEGSGWSLYHAGSLPGTNALAYQRGDGTSYVILFNRRSRSTPPYYTQLMELLNRELGISR